jgi:hypothetical protein
VRADGLDGLATNPRIAAELLYTIATAPQMT